jgi:kynureninase
VLGLALVDASVALLARAGISALRAKSAALVALAVTLHDAWLDPLGCALHTPRGADERGSHIAIGHPDGWRVCRALIERRHVVADFRPPDVVRLGFAPASTRFVDVWDGLAAMRAVLERGEHAEMTLEPRGPVT